MPQKERPVYHYFGYGSNLWLHQVEKRCPTSIYKGVARLRGYRWQINERGYANVVPVSEAGDSTVVAEKPTPTEQSTDTDSSGNTDYSNAVYGLVYILQEDDKERLDRNEDVPYAYITESLTVDWWESDGPVDTSSTQPVRKRMLVYISPIYTKDSEPREEYIYRMNLGIRDAIRMGVPQEYVDQVMRPYIPEQPGLGTMPQQEGPVYHYFGYGSNLWLHQMGKRCPTSTYKGVARLRGYRWQINERGYANVVPVSEASDPTALTEGSTPTERSTGTDSSENTDYSNAVYGLAYILQRDDKQRLDRNEGVPYAYVTENLTVDWWESDGSVDTLFTQPVRKKMVYRMNTGIRDAVKMGVPQEYVDQVMRPYIPEQLREVPTEVENLAARQAADFREER